MIFEDSHLKLTNTIYHILFITFLHYKIKGGKPYLRIHDTKYKILSEIDKILNGDINATRKITLFTEKTCCESCSDVIAQFSQKYPNIEIEVIHNNNIPVI